MKIPNISVFLFVILFSACKAKEEKLTILYNEDSTFIVSAHVPVDWHNYPDTRHHFDEPDRFSDIMGSKDTSACLVVSISSYKRDTTEDLSVTRLVSNIVDGYTSNYSSINFLRKEIFINKKGKHIGIVAAFSPAAPPYPPCYYETIIFSNGKRVCKLWLIVKNDKQQFFNLAYDLERSVTF